MKPLKLTGGAWIALGALLLSTAVRSEIIELDPYRIVAEQWFPQHLGEVQLSSEWDSDEIASAAVLSIDDLLYEDPSFSFYRRQDAIFANPSTQGVSLRNIGATAAGRSLVLVDGVPVNDAFGGWTYWSAIDPQAIESVRMLPSYAAGSWGNMSAGGVISIQTRSGQASNAFNFLAGEASTLASSVLASHSMEKFQIRLNASFLESDGYQVIHPQDRGTIDQRADRKHHIVGLSGKLKLSETWHLSSHVSHFEEKRGNGTPLARNETITNDFSLKLEQMQEDDGQILLLYFQQREFQNTFTSVNADRTDENPVNQQFSIPSSSLGVKWSGFRELDSGVRLMTGVDYRATDGETNENVGWGLKTRRKAGGDQALLGAFLLVDTSGWKNLIAGTSVRVDHWEIKNGARTETDNLSGAINRKDRYNDRNGNELSYSAYLKWQANPSVSMNLSLSRSFRLPTINELYRPFRVRNDITESNALLEPEIFQNVDLSMSWSSPENPLQLAANVFHYWIDDAIANVYQFDGPAQSIGGFVPDGGAFNQKQNVEHSTVSGIRLKGAFNLNETCSARLDYLYSKSKFGTSDRFPEISDQWFPQVPEHKVISRLKYKPNDFIDFEWIWTWASEQYDDAGNSRVLDAYHRHDLLARWRLDPSKLLVLRIKNLNDATILTGKSSSGIRSIAPGRFASLSFRWRF